MNCNRTKYVAEGAKHLRQDNVLGVGLALLGNGVHEGLGGKAGYLGSCQPLCHVVHVHILCKSFLQGKEAYALRCRIGSL